jgi:transposase
MLYVGLDVHATLIVMCVLDAQGQIVMRQQVRQIDELLRSLGRLPGTFAVCFEASCGYGGLYEQLKTVAARVVVAHPGALRMIYRCKRKNDRADAEKLAKLLLLDLVPPVHVPSAEVRAWRELITFRRKLIQARTRAKNGVRALLRTVGVSAPKRPGLWTQRGLEWLKALELTESAQALKRDLLVDEIESLTRKVRRVEDELDRLASRRPEVDQLRSIPGIGARTAEALVAFVDDPHRFAHSRKVGAYFGWVPTQDQSANTNRLGRITREGSPTVRQLMVEAAWQAIRRSPTVKVFYDRVRRDDPDRRAIALVATAHSLTRVCWSMLKHGTLWRESVNLTEPPEHRTADFEEKNQTATFHATR